MAGWISGNRSLIQILPNFAPMQFNTAFCFLLLAGALITSIELLRRVLAGLCLLFVSITLLQYLLNVDLYIDNLFMDAYVNARTSHKGRMAVTTAILFACLASSALVHRATQKNLKQIIIDRGLLLLACTVSYTAIAAYLFSSETVFLWSELSGMALHTAVAHLILATYLIHESNTTYSTLPEHKSSWNAYVCLLMGSLLSIGMWCLSIDFEAGVIKDNLERDAKLRNLVIQNQFNREIAKLKTVERFFAASSSVSSEEFRTFVSPFFTESSSMLAIDWAPFVTADKLSEFIESSKIPRLKQLNNKRELIPHQSAENYFPVLYTSPKEHEATALGFDHYSDALRHRAMDLAVKNNITTGTEPFYLFRSSTRNEFERGLLIATPVYKEARTKDSDSELNSKGVTGFLFGVFKFDQILEYSLEGWHIEGLALELFAENDDGTYLTVYRDSELLTVSESDTSIGTLNTSKLPLTFANRNLLIQFTALPAYIHSHLSAFPLTIFLAATFLTLVTSYYLLYLSKQRQRISNLLRKNNTTMLALEEREQLFKQLAETAPIGIFKTDANGACTYVNPAWLEITGLPQSEALGFGWEKAIHSEDKEMVFEKWGAAVESSRHFSLRFRFIRKDGSTRWIVAEAAPVTRDDGKLLGYIGSNFDFTELNKALEVKNEFMASMSHEIRTPMNSILGFTTRLLKKATANMSERDIDAIMTIDRNAKHLLSLINDILDLTKIESGNLPLERSDFALAQVVSEAIEAVSPLAEAKNIELVFDDHSGQALINADRMKLAQVVSNLLSNSVKYTDEGTIQVLLKVNQQQIILDVKDSGIGIKESDQNKLFRKFSQLDGAEHRRQGGTGLGLCLVKEYVSMHGGTVEVQSEWNVGSTFTVKIPLSPSFKPKVISEKHMIESVVSSHM
jgi:PAS domain S-box-containing protein